MLLSTEKWKKWLISQATVKYIVFFGTLRLYLDIWTITVTKQLNLNLKNKTLLS